MRFFEKIYKFSKSGKAQCKFGVFAILYPIFLDLCHFIHFVKITTFYYNPISFGGHSLVIRKFFKNSAMISRVCCFTLPYQRLSSISNRIESKFCTNVSRFIPEKCSFTTFPNEKDFLGFGYVLFASIDISLREINYTSHNQHI